MDSVGTAVNLLVTIATVVLEKIDKLDRISKVELTSAKDYRRALVAFSKDVEISHLKLAAILQHSDQASLSAFLDSPDGWSSFQRVSHALDSADKLLNDQGRATDALIMEIEQRNSNLINFAALLSDADADNEKFNDVLSAATRSLDDTRDDVTRYFDQFIGLYEIHKSNSSSLSVPSSSHGRARSRSPGHSPLQAIQLSFYDQPFNINVEESCAVEIAGNVSSLTSDKDRLDPYTLSTQEMAERWVDDQLNDMTVAELGRVQMTMLQQLQKVIDTELTGFEKAGPDAPSIEALRCAHLADIKTVIQKEVIREDTQLFSIAFCGMVKAGKSLFLNALIGRMILPSDELPSTAWPCRVQHVKGQLTPSLDIDANYFQKAIDSLQRGKFGALMANYVPPKDTDLFSALLDDFPAQDETINLKDASANAAASSTLKAREIYKSWVDLHPMTKKNLLKFEKDGYRIPERASGEEHVLDLLAQVNDVIRLCRRFNVPLPSEKPRDWPILKIEFDALRDEKFEGNFEFIDLPGVGESHSEYHAFEDLVRRVAKEVNAVVPIVSFKEVSKDDWRQQLPDIIKAGLGRPPELVLCTHLDQVTKDRVEQQVASVAKSFYPRVGDYRNRILCCSSRMGLSARALLRRSQNSKPAFKDIWVTSAVEFDCAEKILGAHKPEMTFDHLSFELWQRSIVDQLAKSGLLTTIKRLVTDMVISSHQRTLIEEGSRLSKQLHKAISNQHRMLLAMRRTAEEREIAYQEFETVRDNYKKVLDEWTVVSTNLQIESSKKLQTSFQLLEREGSISVQQAIESVIKNVKHSKSTYQADTENDELIFYSVTAAEVFLQHVQTDLNRSLSDLKRKFVNFVRKLALQSRVKHFESLQVKIQGFISDTVQTELKEEIIDELSERKAHIEALTFSRIQRRVMHTVATRHTAASAYRALQEAIAKPLLTQKPVDAFVDATRDDPDFDDENDHHSGLDDLGFMVRAPIAVLAAVPWLLGSAIWPFMKRSEKYILNKEAFLDEVKKYVVKPFFDALNKEGNTTLEKMMTKSSNSARSAVRDALVNEEKRYESERNQDNQPSSDAAVASALNSLLNFIAAEAALMKLRDDLKNISVT